MVAVKPFRLGVVEGFFGKAWDWDVRRQYAQFLSANGFTTYLYAPKNDDYFRKQWAIPAPKAHRDALSRLAMNYRDAGVEFGIGLSPYALYLDFSPKQQEALARKLDEINAINPDTLCILFDDMPGDVDDLAARQIRIMEFITRHSKARHFIFCPTYYSDDPVLARHFGKPPANYLEDIGRLLDSRVNIFWTGQKVFSTGYSDDHLLDVADRLRRKPLLWDNYPVNDSQRLTPFLRIRPFENRGPELKQLTQGHMVNPMNQAWLSQIPLYTLGRIYQQSELGPEELLDEACHVLHPGKLGDLLVEDAELFQFQGLDSLSDREKADLVTRYMPYQDHPAVDELFGWLKGDYAFDPACLT